MIDGQDFFDTLLSTILDIVPIAVIIFGFQFAVLRKPLTNPVKVLIGFGYVILGLSLFLLGLELALFPLGKTMARQLTDPEFLEEFRLSVGQTLQWGDYYWVYLFAFLIGFSTTIAEPSLIAVAIKANQVSGGAIQVNGLRIAVALGSRVVLRSAVIGLWSVTPFSTTSSRAISWWSFKRFTRRS